MRVLIIPSWYPTPERPVNGIFVREQAEALNKEHEVRVLFVDVLPRGEKRLPRKRLSKQRGFVEQVIEVSNRPLLWQFNYLWTLVRAFRGLREEFRPDVVHCHVAVPAGFGGVLLKRLFGVPVVLTEHSGDYGMWSRRPGLRLMAATAFSGVDALVCVSESQKSDLQKRFRGGKRALIIPNTVDTALFHSTPYPDVKDAFHLLFIALLESEDKGLGFLLQALAILRDSGGPAVHLDVVGGGSLLPFYEEQARHLGLLDYVTFHGTQAHSAIPRFMQRSHALVLPSLHESQGMVVIEALASGRPVVATRSGGPESAIDSSKGFLIEPGKPQPLADAIAQLLSNLDKYDPQELAENAARRHGHQALVQRLTALYDSLLH